MTDSHNFFARILMSLYGILILSPSGDHPLKRDSDLALKDSYPLLYSSKMKISRNKDAEYNMKGFGAGGLPSPTSIGTGRPLGSTPGPWRTLAQLDGRQVGVCVCVAFLVESELNLCALFLARTLGVPGSGWSFLHAGGGASSAPKCLYGY